MAKFDLNQIINNLFHENPRNRLRHQKGKMNHKGTSRNQKFQAKDKEVTRVQSRKTRGL
jgi:hypothetical protein